MLSNELLGKIGLASIAIVAVEVLVLMYWVGEWIYWTFCVSDLAKKKKRLQTDLAFAESTTKEAERRLTRARLEEHKSALQAQIRASQQEMKSLRYELEILAPDNEHKAD